jgi:sigma-B regulation protein RsbU (phosphoserine phosphatase)
LTPAPAILPICSYCKKVRDDTEYWQKVETYVESLLELGVSHSICPDCHRARMGSDKG